MPKNYDRDEDDAYFTPAWCVDQCINEVLPRLDIVSDGEEPVSILDPGAGKGVFGDRLRSLWSGYDLNITAVEINTDFHGYGYYKSYDRVLMGDFLGCQKEQLGGDFDFAIGNPPYKLAVEFAQHCIQMSRWTILFLRQGFLSSKKRAAWFREHPPASVHMLPNRPIFVGGTSDQSDYCWVVWNYYAWETGTKLYFLDPVPPELRGKKR